MAGLLTDEDHRQIGAIVQRYPQKQAALLMVLHYVQGRFGYLSQESIQAVADELELTAAKVRGVATFYTMYNLAPVGKYHIQVCTNLSCSLMGSETVMDHLKRRLGIGVGETTEDGRFTLSEVECLASCGTAPMMQINDDYYENLTPEKVDEILGSLP